MKVSHERAALIEFLNEGDPQKIAKFLLGAKKLTNHIQEFYGPDLHMPALIAAFANRDNEDIKNARAFLEDYFEARDKKIPVSKLPAEVRRVASMHEAKDEFEKATYSLSRRSVAMGGVELLMAGLSAAGLTKSERQKVVAVTSASGMAGIASLTASQQTAPTQEEILSSLNSFNQQSYTQSISDPLRIIIEAEQQEDLYEGGHMFSPYLIQKLERSSDARQYMRWIIDAAEQNGLDPVLFGNQLFRESIHFSPAVIRGDKDSHAGAMGIAQFIRSTGASYGLNENADFYDPKKSIYAAARYMSDLTDDYNGDQVLAMVAYNGGPKAIEFVEKELGQREITSAEWIEFMKIRLAQFGTIDKSAWHVETLEYVLDITGKNWDTDYQSWALKLQGDEPMLYVEDKISNNSALAAIDHSAPNPG